MPPMNSIIILSVCTQPDRLGIKLKESNTEKSFEQLGGPNLDLDSAIG